MGHSGRACRRAARLANSRSPLGVILDPLDERITSWLRDGIDHIVVVLQLAEFDLELVDGSQGYWL